MVDRARHRYTRTGQPAQRTRTWRPCDGAGAVRGGLNLGGHRGETGARSRGVLAGRDAALLPSAGGCGYLPEPYDAAGGRPLPVGEIRLWRDGRLSDGVEPMGVRGD